MFRILKLILYKNSLVKSLRNPFWLTTSALAFSGYSAYLTLNPNFIKSSGAYASILFFILLTFNIIVAILRSIADGYKNNLSETYSKFIETYALETTKVVYRKLERFKKTAVSLKIGSDFFQHITKPEDQITLLITAIENILVTCNNIKHQDLSITVMEYLPHAEKWSFTHDNHSNWQRTKAQNIITNPNSLAFQCLQSGKEVFVASKEKAAKSGLYYLSENDKKEKDGSVFCYPAIIANPDHTAKFIITISTYNKTLCYSDDVESVQAIGSILNSLCSRLDLELTLKSIKSWKQSNKRKLLVQKKK